MDYFINENYSKEPKTQLRSGKKNGRKLNNCESRVNMQSLPMIEWYGKKKSRILFPLFYSTIFEILAMFL